MATMTWRERAVRARANGGRFTDDDRAAWAGMFTCPVGEATCALIGMSQAEATALAVGRRGVTAVDQAVFGWAVPGLLTPPRGVWVTLAEFGLDADADDRSTQVRIALDRHDPAALERVLDELDDVALLVKRAQGAGR